MPHTKIADPNGQTTASQSDPISFDEASRRIASIARPVGTERVPLAEADGRVLAAPAIAQRCAPMVAVSAMDGFAVRDADIGAPPVRLEIVGKSFAGSGYTGVMKAGQCVRIFTGAPLPPEAGCVVIQENVVVEGSTARIVSRPSKRSHVRAAGSDFHYGDIVVSAGRRLRAQHLIAAAAADLDELEVFRRPRVHIICCGDELVPPGTAGASPARIPESISVGVSALVRRWGGTVTGRCLLPDDIQALTSAADNALRSSDLVVVIGGASVGEKDFAKAAFESFDMHLVFQKVAIKPGKPVWLGDVRGSPVLGLPGNPASALITARLFLAPLLIRMVGDDPTKALQWRPSKIEGRIERCPDRDVFVRASTIGGVVRPLTSQDSADQKALADADTLVRIRSGAPRAASKESSVDTIEF